MKSIAGADADPGISGGASMGGQGRSTSRRIAFDPRLADTVEE